MKPFRRILVPIDFSPRSIRALVAAVNLHGRRRTSFTILHVLESPRFPRSAFPKAKLATSMRQWEADAETALERIARKLRVKGVPMKLLIRVGTPHREIVEAAKTRDADLIVLSSVSDSPSPFAVLGSTAERVVRHAHCSVLVMRS